MSPWMEDFLWWCDESWISQTIQNSLWLFPVIEAVHLLGLALLGGAVLVTDLRLTGAALRSVPIARIGRSAWRFMGAGIVIMLATGIPLFMSEAFKCYGNTSFRVKMIGLIVILLLTFTLKRRHLFHRINAQEVRVSAMSFAVGGVSMLSWFVVAAAGRWVGFS
ncbi:MAG: DUF6644 family protein [Pseudomonadota bacterium]